jgi:membrane-bound lytic murein transglycosylase D
MKLFKSIILTINFLLVTSLTFASSALQIPQTHPDSLFLKDNPVVAQLDSLVNLTFFKNASFTTDIKKLNKYNFPVDSVPQYSDSVYRERINTMAVGSPFEFVFNQQVKHFIDVYAVKKRNLTSRMLGLAELYFPLFEEQLDNYGVPLELKFLPIIESALNPIAKSRVGASGLWQFMLGTGKLYDLKVTSFVDDRCDPYKSTVAACQHLRDLYSIYKDWALCLAAYNAGAGTVNRAIRLANIDSSEKITYWKIQNFLPKETQNYVPAFIAVSYIMDFAAEHNLYPTQPPMLHCDVDSITLTKTFTLSQISSYLCLSLENIQFLNPAYRKGVIPATKETPYVLRLPREYMDEFLVNEDNIYCYKTHQEINYLAQLRLMPETKTVSMTPVKKTTVDKTINTKTTTINTKTTTSQPTTQNQAQTEVKSNTQSNPVVTSTSGSINKIVYHTVQKGDSLWSIASRYTGVSVEEIRRLNNLTVKTTIHPGQKLKIQLKG